MCTAIIPDFSVLNIQDITVSSQTTDEAEIEALRRRDNH